MPTTLAPLSAAQKRRLGRMFRLPGDVRLGDLFDLLLTEVVQARLIGQGSNLSVLNHVTFTAPQPLTIQSLFVTFDVNDVGGATTASHTLTAKRNNAGTAIASLVSTATINKGVPTTLGALDPVTKVLAVGDTVTLDLITGSTSAALQSGIIVITYKVNVTGALGASAL